MGMHKTYRAPSAGTSMIRFDLCPGCVPHLNI